MLSCSGCKFSFNSTRDLVTTSEVIRLTISYALILSSSFSKFAYSDWRSSRFFHRSLMIQLNHPQPFPAAHASDYGESLSSVRHIRTLFRQLVSSTQSAHEGTSRRVES